MSARILVTGGAGYVGSHACKALARAGHEPVVYGDLSRGHRQAVRWGPLMVGDVGDGAALRAALRRCGVTAVMHFAAHAYVGESMCRPREYFRNNVANTLALLDCGVGLAVFSSSCATFGLPERLPIPDDHPQRPVNPYGESKLFGERALRWYDQAYGLRSVSLRYFNAAGADPDGELGENHDPETHLIPLVIVAACGESPRVEILGTDYATPDGTAVRDYVHVSDLAAAHVAALGYLLGGGRTDAFNLGTGRGHSVREVVGAVEAVSGRRVPIAEAPRRPGDPPALVAESGRAGTVLGWEPRRSDLRTIVETAWRWHELLARGRDDRDRGCRHAG